MPMPGTGPWKVVPGIRSFPWRMKAIFPHTIREADPCDSPKTIVGLAEGQAVFLDAFGPMGRSQLTGGSALERR